VPTRDKRAVSRVESSQKAPSISGQSKRRFFLDLVRSLRQSGPARAVSFPDNPRSIFGALALRGFTVFSKGATMSFISLRGGKRRVKSRAASWQLAVVAVVTGCVLLAIPKVRHSSLAHEELVALRAPMERAKAEIEACVHDGSCLVSAQGRPAIDLNLAAASSDHAATRIACVSPSARTQCFVKNDGVVASSDLPALDDGSVRHVQWTPRVQPKRSNMIVETVEGAISPADTEPGHWVLWTQTGSCRVNEAMECDEEA